MTFHEIQLVVGAALDHGAGAGQPATDAIEIATLAALGPIEYDRVRKAAAARLRVRADTLDELVRDAKIRRRTRRTPGRPRSRMTLSR